MTVEARVDQMPITVGRRVRDARVDRGMTLDHLAAESGVSRRMIVNVESGSSNASIATLLRLASALQVSLAELVSDGADTACTVTTAAERRPLWEGDRGGSAVLVSSADMLELWDWTLFPGEVYESDAHRSGTRELLHVLSGRLQLIIGGNESPLRAGDGASFLADAPHSYGCLGRGPVRFAMTVLEPMSRMRP